MATPLCWSISGWSSHWSCLTSFPHWLGHSLFNSSLVDGPIGRLAFSHCQSQSCLIRSGPSLPALTFKLHFCHGIFKSSPPVEIQEWKQSLPGWMEGRHFFGGPGGLLREPWGLRKQKRSHCHLFAVYCLADVPALLLAQLWAFPCLPILSEILGPVSVDSVKSPSWNPANIFAL